MEQAPLLQLPMKASYSAEIQEVHNQFYGYENQVLEKAEQFAQTSSITTAPKLNLLEKLGFTNTTEYVNYEVKKKEKEQVESERRIIAYYKRKYVLYKYISESGVREICQKYNLVVGRLNDYTGFVPEKNLEEISKFKIDTTDYGDYVSAATWSEEMSRSVWFTTTAGGMVTYDSDGRRFTQPRSRKKKDKEKTLNFSIAAPLNTMQVSPGYEVVENKIIYDPVVLAPVEKGGYLIVTAWGDEASDPLVANTEVYN